jgi:hypothetical protein
MAYLLKAQQPFHTQLIATNTTAAFSVSSLPIGTTEIANRNQR